MLLLTFSSGEKRVFDATVLKGDVFAPLNNPAVFNNFKIVHGVITWMNEEIDCAPEFMYEHSFPYNREKEAVQNTIHKVQNRPALAYRTALHRFSLAGPPERYNQSQHLNYIISRTSAQGASFLYPFLPSGLRNLPFATSQSKEK